MAVLEKSIWIALALLKKEANANVNAQDRFGNTPLHYAAYSGAEDMVALLLEAQANVNAQNLEKTNSHACSLLFWS